MNRSVTSINFDYTRFDLKGYVAKLQKNIFLDKVDI